MVLVFDAGVSQVAFLAGCLYTAVGVLKLGWLTNFLSHSVISGFMSGASVIIALSQVGLSPADSMTCVHAVFHANAWSCYLFK